MARWISHCTDAARGDTAQATVEAALLLPVFLTVMLIVLQPVCVLYTRAVMESTAAETARLMVGAEDADAEGYRAFALRRLRAVPDLAIFHAGGPYAWELELTCAPASGGEVAVRVAGAVRPLPVLGVFVRALGHANGQGDVELEVEVRHEGVPSWLEGSYETWTAVWN